ncbi:hypothetical protein EKO04_006292 [Ascochyta lentis]|uniref:DNA-directed RNA polymerase subunit n=1 Tax=Ascochyta lentis TaxID=205686 RepID=A0A8H7MJL5_9PLEO|nr:hypothetical protein EKO04_006292 [Ascochyta lentis]
MAPMPNDDSPLLHTERISQFVSLPPAALATPLPALCASYLSPLLLSYFAPAHGVVLAYDDVALSSSPPTATQSATNDAREPVMLRHVDEYASPFLWVTATFLVWRPRHNKFVTGRVTHQSKTHLTLSYLNLFPVSILATQVPQTWTFTQSEAGAVDRGRTADEGGVWVDEDGNEVAGDLRVRLLDFDARTDGKAKGKGLRLEGSLLSENEERRREKGKGKAKRGILKAQSSQEVE